MEAATGNGAARSSTPYKLDAISRVTTIAFTLRDQEWRISSDPDVEVVATMLRLEREIRALDDADTATSIVDAKELILDLLEDLPQKQPVDRAHFRIGVGEILTLFALISGGESVADMVAEGITAGMSTAREAGEFSEEELAAAAAGDEDAAPLASRSHSSGRSSGSGESTSGRLAGGGV